MALSRLWPLARSSPATLVRVLAFLRSCVLAFLRSRLPHSWNVLASLLTSLRRRRPGRRNELACRGLAARRRFSGRASGAVQELPRVPSHAVVFRVPGGAAQPGQSPASMGKRHRSRCATARTETEKREKYGKNSHRLFCAVAFRQAPRLTWRRGVDIVVVVVVVVICTDLRRRKAEESVAASSRRCTRTWATPSTSWSFVRRTGTGMPPVLERCGTFGARGSTTPSADSCAMRQAALRGLLRTVRTR